MILLFVIDGPKHPEGRRHQLILGVRQSGGRQQVAGQLLGQESIEWFVVVERPNHIIAISPRCPEYQRTPTAARFGETNHVQPVASPSLAELRRREQAINDLGEGVLRGVGREVGQLLRRGWQPGQVERDAAQQRFAIGVNAGGNSLLLELGEHKLIHVIR